MSTSVRSPLRFTPILKPRAWGGRSLQTLGKTLPDGAPFGESWDLADLPTSIDNGRSHVADGAFAGTSLHDLLDRAERDILGGVARAETNGFPLLVKFLDAADNLSLQVHPNEAYCAAHPGAFPKTEAWFVLHAAAGSKIYRGVRHDVTPETFRAAILDGSALDLMHAIEVNAGDCVRLPSGICHALGAGVLVAELQTPSDTTFRVWDWNRNDPNRPLHIDQALETMRFGNAQDTAGGGHATLASIPVVDVGGVATKRICSMREFSIDHITLTNAPLEVEGDNAPSVVLCIEGTGSIDAADGSARFRRGDVVLVPAACRASVSPNGAMTLLRTDLPVVPGVHLA